MATATKSKKAKRDGYSPRLKDRFDAEIRDRLKEQFGYSSVMKVPRIEKITVNMGVGDAKVNAKALDRAVDELTIITGQRAQITRAKKSIAGFKIREGSPYRHEGDLRGARMEFLDRLVSIALPRIRDFAGLSPASFDGRATIRSGSGSRSSSRRSTTTTSRPCAASTSPSRRRRTPMRRRSRSCASSASRSAQKHRRTVGEEKSDREGSETAEVQVAGVHALQPLRPPARGLPQVRPVPDLPARARP
jgi:large subunit ribosomal protein L5